MKIKTNDVYEQAIDYVMNVRNEEFSELSVSTLAHSLGICRFKLARQFKNQTDMTLEHFLFKIKMTRSVLLLLTKKEMTIREIAEVLGFCSCDYFIRKFKEFYGVRPGTYRSYKQDVIALSRPPVNTRTWN